MSKRGRLWSLWIEEMRSYLEKIDIVTKNISQEQFLEDFRVHDIVLMNIANIGEASTNIPDDIKQKYSDID